MNMQPGDRVKWGALHGVVVSHVRTTEPFEPKDRCFVRFDGGLHEWVNTSALSKIADTYLGLPCFTALDWFHISGRGDVAAVTLDRDCQRSELLTLFARVRIDGNEYAVKGVESFVVEQQRKGWTIGLLVEGPTTPKA